MQLSNTFYSPFLFPTLLFALSIKLDNGRSDKLQVSSRSLLSVSHSIYHFHFPFRFNRMSKAADTLPLSSLSVSVSASLSCSFFGATVKGRLFTWQIARNSFHYHASIVASSLFDGLFPRPLIFYALCLYAPLHSKEEEKNGGPTGRLLALMLPARRARLSSAETTPTTGHRRAERALIL